MTNGIGTRDERWQIQIRGLHKSFGSQQVLRGIDLDFERGKTNIVIGGSGQGKSVLMKHLMGLLQPDSGHIYVDGEDIVGLGDVAIAKIQRKFGMVFQYAASATACPEARFWLGCETCCGAWIWTMFQVSKRSSQPSFPVVCESVWAWRARWSTGPRFCSTMSPPPAWTRLPPRTSMK